MSMQEQAPVPTCSGKHGPHLLSKFDRVTSEPCTELGVQVGSRGDLYHLLVPPLDGAVPLIQVQDVSVLVPWGRQEASLSFSWELKCLLHGLPVPTWALWPGRHWEPEGGWQDPTAAQPQTLWAPPGLKLFQRLQL
jgi:hypothetical protein